MTSISDTIRLTNQALENALTTASVPKITASDKQAPIHQHQPSTKTNVKVTKKTVADDDTESHKDESTQENEIKHIDIRI